MSTSSFAEILRNNLDSSVRLKDFATYLKSSEIGDLRIHLYISVILVSVSLQQLIVGKLKTNRKPKSEQNFQWLAELPNSKENFTIKINIYN